MSLRRRIFLASLALTILPLLLVMQVTRGTVKDRFAELDGRRMEDQMRLARQDLRDSGESIASRLDGLARTMAQDNRLRRALLDLPPEEGMTSYLRDYASRLMPIMELDFLQIQDPRGTVLSSGHFKQNFGDEFTRLPTLLADAPGGRALVTARTASGPILVQARVAQVSLGGSTFDIIGGRRLDPAQMRDLSEDDALQFILAWPGGLMSTDETLTRRLVDHTRPEEIPLALRHDDILVRWDVWPLLGTAGQGGGAPDSAYLIITHDQTDLKAALAGLNLRLGLIFGLAVLFSASLAFWSAARLSQPLRQLSLRAEELDFDNLDVEFAVDGHDEVGRLASLLNRMTGRLRNGIDKLRDAEHRATLGEVARQVNHDVRNGITPLRNVLRHLGEVAEKEPDQLGRVFQERSGTLENGLSYLEELAEHYARISPERKVGLVRLDGIVTEALATQTPPDGVQLENRLPVNLPPVEADPVSLRRIFDNLLRNALQSLPAEGGKVAVSAFLEEDLDLEEMRLQVEIADTGKGIEPENLDKIFNDFFTTRPDGTGLGLSNVRRLAADCGAHVNVQSEVGVGTVLVLSFPLPNL